MIEALLNNADHKKKKKCKATTEHKNKFQDVRQGSHLDGLTAVLGGTRLVGHTW